MLDRQLLSASPYCPKDRTFRTGFQLQGVNRPKPERRVAASTLYHNPVNQALNWQARLDSRPGYRPADLARDLGVSRARVTQVLGILKLAPAVIETVSALGDPLPRQIISERRLRLLANVEETEQLHTLRLLMRGTEVIAAECPKHISVVTTE